MDAARHWVSRHHANPRKRLLLGYLFNPQEYPWAQNWEDYRRNQQSAHGLEFSPSRSMSRGARRSNCTRCLAPPFLPALALTTIRSRFLMFYTHTPEGMTEIDDVRLENGKISIEDRKANKRVTLAASLLN